MARKQKNQKSKNEKTIYKRYLKFLNSLIKKDKTTSIVAKELRLMFISIFSDVFCPVLLSKWDADVETYSSTLSNASDVKKLNAISSLLHKFAKIEDRVYSVIGYGSLVNSRSRDRTATIVSEHPVDVIGWSRIFDLHHGTKGGTVLNVFKDVMGVIPSVLIEVNGSDMYDLLAREFQYDIEVVPIDNIRFSYGDDYEILHPPYMFVSSVDKCDEEPLEEYVQACIYGAGQFDEKFLEKFVDSCYIYDGQPLRQYLLNKHSMDIISVYKELDSEY